MEGNNKAIWWVVGIIIVLIIAGVLIFGGKEGDEQTIDSMNGDDAATSMSARIMIDDQYPGKIVYVSSVTLPQNGFVAIQKDNVGKAGAVIGNRFFRKGTNPGSIELSESTVEGMKYYAALYKDDGDGIFNAAKDMPFTDSAGQPIMKMFNVSKSIPEVKG